MMSVYFNEHDRDKAEVLRELMRAGVIAPGDVDERSIKDVRAGDLLGYTQCHFFAGIGVWSYAARCAGWPDSRPMWSGSCPCPSFSAAGKGGGFDDPRHLWPDWARLIGECKPPVLFGEQADDAIGYGWLDLVQANLEAQAYAVGKTVLGAHSVSAPHIRQRLYFVADTGCSPGAPELQHEPGQGPWGRAAAANPVRPGERGSPGELADTTGFGRQRGRTSGAGAGVLSPEWCGGELQPERSRNAGSLGHSHLPGSARDGGESATARGLWERLADSGQHGRLGIAEGPGLQECIAATRGHGGSAEPAARPGLECGGDAGALADTGSSRRNGRSPHTGWGQEQRDASTGPSEDGELADNHLHGCASVRGACADGGERNPEPRGAVGGFWADADWIPCRDPKVPGGIEWRAIEPGTFPLAHGAAARVLALRCFGDAIVAPLAEEWIRTYCEARGLNFGETRAVVDELHHEVCA